MRRKIYIHNYVSRFKIVQKDPKNTKVYVTLDIAGAKGSVCELELTLADKEDHKGTLKTTVDLK